VKTVELARQSLQRTTFRYQDEEVRLTARGAITEVNPDDGYEAVLDRLEAAIDQANHAGPNRSCLHRGGKIEPVESPNLGAKYEEVMI
jgi:PleD family two-component response regulator